MTRYAPAVLLGLAVAGAALPAVAQPAAPSAPAPGWGAADPFGDATLARKDAADQATARFAKADANGDGVLSPEELRAARLDGPGRDGPPHEGGGEARHGRDRSGGMARMLDAGGDGRITRDEFVSGSLRRFDRMDADHDGLLTRSERDAARAAMRARMEQRMGAMMSGGDMDDGPAAAMGGGDD